MFQYSDNTNTATRSFQYIPSNVASLLIKSILCQDPLIHIVIIKSHPDNDAVLGHPIATLQQFCRDLFKVGETAAVQGSVQQPSPVKLDDLTRIHFLTCSRSSDIRGMQYNEDLIPSWTDEFGKDWTEIRRVNLNRFIL